MALTNETKYVTVRRLNRFRNKLRAELPSTTVASDATCEAIVNELV